MYVHIVHCRVIVDNKCEFEHSSSHSDSTFHARRVSKTGKKARLPTDSCLNNSKRPILVNSISTNPECRSDHRWLVYNHSLVLNNLKHLLFAKVGFSQCSQKFELHLAIALLLFFSFLFSRHDPFIVRSAKLVHHSMVSLSVAPPSRCLRPTLIIVCFCAAAPSPARSPARRHLAVECGSMINRIRILQTCNVVVVLK